MNDDLNEKTYYTGTPIAGLSWSFTRPTGDTRTVYTGCAIALRIFRQSAKGVPTSQTPTLSLSLTSGLNRVTDTASLQAGTLEINTTNLLGDAIAARFGYVWSITPVGGAPLRAPMGGGFDGWFVIAQEGYAGAASIKIPSAAP